jgi:RNA polymerase sigma factor (sigma-70 family)
MDDVIRSLHKAALLQGMAGMTDGDLLECYLRRRDEEAFEALVRRHGPMVWGVCRRVLRNEADAADAFQATFLVLVRKASSIVPRSRVGNWLYGVARNTAVKARALSRKRRATEQRAGAVPRSEPPGDDQAHFQTLLDEELRRLPEKYRAPIVLCALEGRTLKEAAQHLGWPQGTVAGRLARARGLLAKRLSRRGLALSAGALATAVSAGAAPASVPMPLVVSTVKAAPFAAGPATAAGVISPQVAALFEGVMRAMLLTRIKTAATVVLAAAALAGALVVLVPMALPSGQPEAQAGQPQKPAVREGDRPQAGTTWKERQAIAAEGGAQIFAAPVSAHGKVVASATTKGVKLWDALTGKELASVDPDFAFTAAISPDGKTLATGHIKAIKLWDAVTGKELATLAGDSGNVSKVAFAPDGKVLATAEAGALRLWDLAAKKELRRLESGKTDGRVVYAVAFSPDGKTLASAEGTAKTVILWDVATGKESRTLEGHARNVIDVAFSPDGKTLASAGGDGEVKLWDAATGKERLALKWQTSGRHSLAFSPDGKLLATAGGDSNNVMLWDVKTGKDLVTLDHKGHVWSVSFSGDGATLVTAGDDAVRIWQAEKK